MNNQKAAHRDVYYTNDHEWIDFQGTVAYTGVCHFKLLGFKGIHRIRFTDKSGFRKKGEVIAQITYNEYQIDAHMPVDGKIVQVNEDLLTGDQNRLIQTAENSGWLIKLIPSQPYERKDLLLPKQYQLNGKDKYAK